MRASPQEGNADEAVLVPGWGPEPTGEGGG